MLLKSTNATISLNFRLNSPLLILKLFFDQLFAKFALMSMLNMN